MGVLSESLPDNWTTQRCIFSHLRHHSFNWRGWLCLLQIRCWIYLLNSECCSVSVIDFIEQVYVTSRSEISLLSRVMWLGPTADLHDWFASFVELALTNLPLIATFEANLGTHLRLLSSDYWANLFIRGKIGNRLLNHVRLRTRHIYPMLRRLIVGWHLPWFMRIVSIPGT